ncbi:MAG: AEC family transporter [Clostridia bacterium]|nr:AEC family transporter [Clostridia bacterium]
MSIIPDLIFNVAVLFVMLVPGIVMQKCKLVPAGFGKGISNLVLYIAQPILIVSAYVNCKSSFGDIWQNILWVFILSIIAHVIFAAVALNMFGRTEDGRRRILRLVTIFANAAFMGIPLIEALLDAEAAIYASIYNITFNLFLWTLGVFLCTRNSDEDMDGDGDSDVFDDLHVAKKVATKEVSISKVILHPVTIASVIGVILLVTGANTAIGANLASEAPSVVIEFIVNCLNMIKGLVAPLSMVVIGLRLAEVNFKGLFKDIDMYIFLALRHLVLPLVLVGIMRLLMLVGVPISEVCLLVVTILAATPAASSATMFAEKYDCDAGYASKLVAVSTILCILTMPVVVMIAQLGL